MILHSRHLTAGQRAMIADSLRKYEAERAKERQRERKGSQPGASKENSPYLNGRGQVRDKIGEKVGVSGISVDVGKQIAAGRYKDLVAKEQAAKRKAQAKGKPRGTKADSSAKTGGRDARDEAGQKFGVGHGTVDAAAKVIKRS